MFVEVINGFLGSGKTTLLQNLLRQSNPVEKTVVLVNEFGEVGIDGDLLSGRGADVVELSNGCICCTLKADLRNQVQAIAEELQPDRLYIEPTGVATIKNLMSILGSLTLEKYIDDIRITLVVDAAQFNDILMQNRGYVETQIQTAHIVIINKCDKVDEERLIAIRTVIMGINGSAKLLAATYGQISIQDFNVTENTRTEKEQGADISGHVHETALKNFEQFSISSDRFFKIDQLRDLFKQLKSSKFGFIDRAKGIFRLSQYQWVRLDMASGDINEFTEDKKFDKSKIVIIGTEIKSESLRKSFEDCWM